MLRVGYQTYAGNRYQGLNQDRLLSHHVKKLNKTSKEANNIWLWGVFDGHNCLGELAAAACCDSFQKTFNNVSIWYLDQFLKNRSQIQFSFFMILSNPTAAVVVRVNYIIIDNFANFNF
jgi:serine/threonine protein phosphatase PrpC